MAHGSTLWAAATAAGAKDGTSLANAAGIDPGVADDIWTIVNADVPASGGTTIKLCAEEQVATTAKIEITRDAAVADPFIVKGRGIDDIADAQVVLDADDGAFPVVQLTTADYWRFLRITAQNTDENTPNHAWDVGVNADNCGWYSCKGIHAFRGFGFNTGSASNLLALCEASDNVDYGFYGGLDKLRGWGCISHNNGGRGHYGGIWSRCIASENGGDGWYYGAAFVGCIAYSNTGYGFDPYVNALVVDCIAVDNSSYGFDATSGSGPSFLVNFAHYNNTSGAINGARKIEIGTIALTADPFVDAANRDFRLNKVAGGGVLLRGIAHPAIDGNWTDYSDIGAVQHRMASAVAGGVLLRG